MTLPKSFIPVFVLATLSLALGGCMTHSTTVPMAGGYEEVSHPVHTFIALDEPQPPRISFQHRSTDGKVTPVWPALYGVNEIIKDDLAIFVGDKAYISPDRVTQPRLFAVKSPALPLDITDEVLRLWAKAVGKDLRKTLDKFNGAMPEQTENGIKIRIEFASGDKWMGNREDWPETSSLQLEWRQVEQIMALVKSKGTMQKDLRWSTPYIGENL